jgi:hypothetical protein
LPLAAKQTRPGGGMTTPQHDILATLFRNRPELAPELLRALHLPVPEYAEARLIDPNTSDVAVKEYRSDVTVQLVHDTSVLGIVVEVQRKPDSDKKYSWPVYLTTQRARLKCPMCVLVVTIGENVARWARKPIVLGPQAQMQPLVVGPDAVPVIEDAEQARADPELAVLSAMAHGNSSLHVVLTAFGAIVPLDDERVRLYPDLIYSALCDAMRAKVEAIMNSGTYEYQSDFARKYVAQGRAEGRAFGEATAVLSVLEARHHVVTEEQKKQILACTDLEVLDRWLRKAVVLSSVEELFE